MTIESDLTIIRNLQCESNIVNYDYSKSGQQISRFSNDDGAIQAGNNLVDLSKLSTNNPFGNNNRFTDELGTQNFTNKIILDWRSFNGTELIGWFKFWLPKLQLKKHVEQAPYVRGGYKNWNVANIIQLSSLMDFTKMNSSNLVDSFNFHPFNWSLRNGQFNGGLEAINTENKRLWSSTFLTGNNYWLISSNSTIAYTNYWGFHHAVLTRVFTLKELGL